MLPRKARILEYDIETFPELGTAWGRYERDTLWVEREGLLASFAYKWSNEKRIHVKALCDYPRYTKDLHDDSLLTADLYKIITSADLVVAHNGDSFDQKICNTRFIKHGFDPVPAYKQVDTLKIARKHFKFPSNKLDDLGDFLGVGRKIRTGGKDLWKDCYYGDLKAWRKMKAYNKQDVALLERVYLRLLPWATTHPNLALIENRPDNCPKCGSDAGFIANGWHHTTTSRYRRFKCRNCRSNVQGKQNMGVKTVYK